MKKRTKAVKIPKSLPPEMDDFNYINSYDFPFCCGVEVIGEFDDDYEGINMEKDFEYTEVSEFDDEESYDEVESVPIDWSNIPAKVLAEIKKGFESKKAQFCTTIIQNKGGKAVSLTDRQGVANKVLRLTGWKKVIDWKNPNSGNTLRMWMLPPVTK